MFKKSTKMNMKRKVNMKYPKIYKKTTKMIMSVIRNWTLHNLMKNLKTLKSLMKKWRNWKCLKIWKGVTMKDFNTGMNLMMRKDCLGTILKKEKLRWMRISRNKRIKKIPRMTSLLLLERLRKWVLLISLSTRNQKNQMKL